MPQSIWLPYILLLAAYIAFGRYLNATEASHLAWIITIFFVIALAGIMTMLWKPARSLTLLGFRSDAGYFVMVMLFASLAVLVLAWVHIFAYILVMIATSLLVRIDALRLDFNNLLTFLILVGIPLAGLGLNWLPLLLTQA